jgi:hypothetical protein
MKNYLKKMFALMSFIMFFFAFSSNISVFAGFGVSPAEIIQNHLKPGAHFEQQLILSRADANEDLKIKIEPELDEFTDWFSFKPGEELIFKKGVQRLPLTVVVDVPSDVEYQSYIGKIRILASPFDSDLSGVSVVKGARVDVSLITTELDVTLLVINQIKAADVLKGEKIRLGLLTTNNGNVPASPSRVKLTILNLLQEPLQELEATDIEQVLPNETKEIFVDFEADLDKGEYFGEVEVYLGEELLRKDRVVFQVNEDIVGKQGETDVFELSFLTSLKDYVENNSEVLLYIALIYGSVSLGVILVLLRGIEITARGKAIMIVLLLAIFVSLISLLTAAFVNWQNESMDQENTVSEEDFDDSQEIEESQVVPEVQGVTTSDVERTEVVAQPVVVGDKNKPDGFFVYVEPNSKSQVIYVANSGETFSVLDQQDEWYKVLLTNGDVGWLMKKDIAKEEVK